MRAARYRRSRTNSTTPTLTHSPRSTLGTTRTTAKLYQTIASLLNTVCELLVNVIAVRLADGQPLGATPARRDSFLKPAAWAVQTLGEVGHVRRPMLGQTWEQILAAEP